VHQQDVDVVEAGQLLLGERPESPERSATVTVGAMRLSN
jgi:hypothetical protein